MTLLTTWANLEPERCRVSALTTLLQISVGDRWVTYPTPTDILQAAIEAIEARDWQWTVSGDGAQNFGTIHASIPLNPRTIYPDGTTSAPELTRALGTTPASALLRAYLLMLEQAQERTAA